MKLRTVFITDKHQESIPEGWNIEKMELITHLTRKAQYCVLLSKAEDVKKPLGFRK